MKRTLKIPPQIRKQFPKVTQVRDATKTIEVEVTSNDASSGRKKDPGHCALAKACLRKNLADSVIIGLAYSWLIKDKIATRYKTSVAVGREITSFDRHQDFAAGENYKLSKVCPANRMGVKHWPKSGPRKSKRLITQKVHHTTNVRQLKKFKD